MYQQWARTCAQPVSEEHADDRHHRELLGLGLRVAAGQNLETEVTWLALGAVHARICSQPAAGTLEIAPLAIGDVRVHHAHGRGQLFGQLADYLRGDAAHGRKHRDAAVIDLRGAAALEGVMVPVAGEAQRAPEAERGLPLISDSKADSAVVT